MINGKNQSYRFTNWNLAKKAETIISQLTKVKTANIGGDAEASFEQAFATLAHTYLQDRAPRLLDYLVGFQLVDRNDDNNRAVGVFGFKVGGTWLYAPVFFLSGDLKGHELLYLKEKDTFVPLKENWVNYIIAKKPHVLGNMESRTPSQLGMMQPDFSAISVPPSGGKSASVNMPNWQTWANGFAPLLGALDDVDAGLEKFAGLSERLSLDNFLSENVQICKVAMRVLDSYPVIADTVKKYYGDNLIKEALLRMREGLEKKASVLGQKSAADKVRMASVLGGPPVRTAAEKVAIKVNEDVVISQNMPELSDSQREKLLRDSYLIEDARTGEEVSVVYNTQTEMSLVNPAETGIYDVLLKPGVFERCLVVVNPKTHRKVLDSCLVMRLSPRNWQCEHRNNIFARPASESFYEYTDWLKGLDGVKTLPKRVHYIALLPNGEVTAPFKPTRDYGDGRYDVYFKDSEPSRPSWLPNEPESLYDSYWPQDEAVQLNCPAGTRLKAYDGVLQIPEAAVILELKEDVKTSDECCESFYDSSVPKKVPKDNNPPVIAGSLNDVHRQILEKTAAMKVYSTGTEVTINGGESMPHRSALLALVGTHGLREKAAKQLLKHADAKQAFRGRIKYAYGYPLQDGSPTAPAIPAQTFGSDSLARGLQTTGPEEHSLNVSDMSASNTDPNTWDMRPEALPDAGTMQAAARAGESGQKEVFDTAMIGGLLKSVRQDSLVSRYLGDLLSAEDRLGRLLFMFYWHNDEFEDQYGKADMPELEDTLRNAFEILGDLILFLKEKDVAPLPGPNLSEPDIESASTM